MNKLIFYLFLLLVLPTGLAKAGPYEHALIQYNDGNFVQAFKLLQPFAEQGDAQSQADLGFMYRQGNGVSQNYKQAVDWYRKAAVQGHTGAQYNLGLMYGGGEGVPQDFIYAHMWLNLAGINGDGNALKFREIIADKMTRDQIDEAQKLAGLCKKRNYNHCDQHRQAFQDLSSRTRIQQEQSLQTSERTFSP